MVMHNIQPQQHRTTTTAKMPFDDVIPTKVPQQQHKQEVMDILACLDDSQNNAAASVATTVSCSASLSSDGGVSLENLSLETIPLSSTTIIDGPVSYCTNEKVNGDTAFKKEESPKEAKKVATTTNTRSAGFSELMQAADDMLGSYDAMMMSPVLENYNDGEEQEEESTSNEEEWQTILIPGSEVLGQLIVTAGENPEYISSNNATSRATTPLLRPHQLRNNRQAPRFSSLLALARSYIRPVTFLSRDSFEVSMTMDPNCTKQDVMRILGHPDVTLTKWFEPVQELIVTNRSGGGRSSDNNGSSMDYNNSHVTSSSSSGREYDGEWINAFTPSGTLVSPSSGSGGGGDGFVSRYYHGTKVAVLDAIGFSSCGKVDMFVERRLGQLSFVVGPFPGGIFAAHTVTVTIGEGGGVEVVDRVRLQHEEESTSTSGSGLSGLIASGPLGRCFLPSVAGYAEQTASSMARLWVLVNHGEAS